MWSNAYICLLSVVSALVAGCSQSSTARYTPSPTVAKEALTAALEAWRQGQDSRQIKSYSVPIQVADSLRRPEQKLKAFEILGEVSEEGGRIFQVKLQMEQPNAEEKVQFVVVGIDPLWVIRRHDYDMLTHWEHPATPSSSESSGAASTAKPPNSG